MTGAVTPDREAVIRLLVRGPNGDERPVDSVLDTGFTGHITLPRSLISALALPFDSPAFATLADGSQVIVDVYIAAVVWDGKEREVFALAAEGGPLLGMSLLYGSRVTLDVIDGGPVTTGRIR